MSQFIKGPWWVDDDGDIAMGSGDDYHTVAEVICSGIGLENKRGVRNLIAASPELLEECKAVITDISNCGRGLEEACLGLIALRLEKIIMKAEGRRP